PILLRYSSSEGGPPHPCFASPRLGRCAGPRLRRRLLRPPLPAPELLHLVEHRALGRDGVDVGPQRSPTELHLPGRCRGLHVGRHMVGGELGGGLFGLRPLERQDRKSTRLNSSHQIMSYAVFGLKKKTK